MECTIENRKLIPLSKVVSASIIDTYGDIGKMEHRNSQWASRGLKKLYNESLPKTKHKVWLTVNKNTHTATLPLDFNEETFVGFVDTRWHKVPLKLNNRITDTKNIIDVLCEDACPKCNQDLNICNDLVITETSNLLVIGGNTYEEIITKKLYPNGDYYLETSTWVYDMESATAVPFKKKEFIVNFDLLPCGCLETTSLNKDNLIAFCPDIYCNYYAPCDTQCCTDIGGYKIFVESGLMQLDQSFPYDKVYLEYYGFITKKNGQYMVPEVAFETLVEWTKFKQIQNKTNLPDVTIRRWEESYKRERRNMQKILGRISLYRIIQSISLLPKLDIDYGDDWYGSCFSQSAGVAAATAAAAVPSVNTACCTTTTFINRTAYTLAVKVNGNPGSPVAGLSTYQNNVLIGALDITYLFLAKQILSILDGDFTFNPSLGTLDISPNIFVTGDSLIVNYNKNT